MKYPTFRYEVENGLKEKHQSLFVLFVQCLMTGASLSYHPSLHALRSPLENG